MSPLLGAVLMLCAFATVVTSRAVLHDDLDSRSFDLLMGKRDDNPACTLYCEAGACNDGCPTKRDEEDFYGGFNDTVQLERYLDMHHNETLAKRVLLDLPSARSVEFYVGISKNLLQPGHQLLPRFDSGVENPSFCIQRKWSDLAGAERWGTNGPVYGCTVVALLSSQGFYMCHLWEVPHFVNPDQRKYPSVSFGDILDLITGDRDYGRHGIAGPGIDSSLFDEGSNPYLYIATPQPEFSIRDVWAQSTPIKYPTQIGNLIRLIYSFAYGLTYDRQAIYKYWKSRFGPATKGAFILEWDPQAGGENRPDWRLFLEGFMVTGSSVGQF